jgi:hypothetical protein
MTQSITAKPKTVQEAITYIQNHYPDADINEAMIRQALELDEDAPDPPGLTEAFEHIQQESEQEEDTEETPPSPPIAKTAPIVRMSESLNRSIAPQKQSRRIPTNAEKLQEEIDWASEQQGESAESAGIFQSKQLKDFVSDISDKNSQLREITGKTGTGKTTTQKMMEAMLDDRGKVAICYTVHDDNLFKIALERLSDDLPKKTIEKLILKLLPFVSKDDKKTDDFNSPESLKYYLNLVKDRNIKQAFAADFFVLELICTHIDFFLIEFKDYDRKDMRQFNSDIGTIAEFWRNLSKNNFYANIVLFIQQEMFEQSVHHFLLKDRMPLTLQPPTPEELTAFYCEQFYGNHPFTKEALFTIASCSHGNWRLWKTMMYQCLNNYQRKNDLNAEITAENVSQWIPSELLLQDQEAEQEFAEVFPHSPELQKKTALTISYLKQHPEGTFQQDIAKTFFGPDGDAKKDCSKFCIKLHEIGIIEKEWKNGLIFIKLKSKNP